MTTEQCFESLVKVVKCNASMKNEECNVKHF